MAACPEREGDRALVAGALWEVLWELALGRMSELHQPGMKGDFKAMRRGNWDSPGIWLSDSSPFLLWESLRRRAPYRSALDIRGTKQPPNTTLSQVIGEGVRPLV